MRALARPSAHWPPGGGEMGALVRAFDWSRTPIGPAEAWPASLRTAVDMVLGSQFPMMVMWGEDLIQIYNDRMRRTLGGKHPDALGRPARETWAEMDPQRMSWITDVLSGDTVTFADEPWLMARHGALEEVFFTACYSPVHGDGGEVAGVFAVTFETTGRIRAKAEREKAAAELREREERFRKLFELASVGQAQMDPHSLELRAVNRRLCEMLGYAEDELTGRSELDLTHPDDRAANLAAWERVLAGEQTDVAMEKRLMRRDGRPLWVQISMTLLADARGRPELATSVIMDISARKRAQEALAESERRMRSLVEGIPQLVWSAVDGGELTWASPQWSAYTGLSEEESLGEGWIQAVHPEDREAAAAAWGRAEPLGGLEMEVRLYSAQERRYRVFQARATPVRDEHGDLVEWLGACTDVDDLHRLKEHQQVLLAELHHRTRNLLTVVQSIARQTMRTSQTLEEFEAAFEDRLAALSRVQGLLARGEAGEPTLGEIVRMELAALGALPGDLRVFLDGPEVRLPSIAVQTLALALHELATNALKYGALAKPGGRLKVTWSLHEDGGEPWSNIEWLESGIEPRVETHSPTRRGFGRELIERVLPRQLGAQTVFELREDSVRCAIDLPLDGALHEDQP